MQIPLWVARWSFSRLSLAVCAANLCFSAVQLAAETLSETEAETIGIESYIFGYPLVTMDMTKRVMTNAVAPGNDKAPMGQFFNARIYPNASFNAVTAPNVDTLYSFAWLDLSKEPYVLHLPDEKARYYLMPLISAWTNVFQDPGTRTTGTAAADYAITGPAWKGTLPSGLKEFKSPTNLIWILGRTYSTGTPEDYTAVHKLQEQYSLKPLSFFGKTYSPPRGIVDANIDMHTSVRDQVNKLSAQEFFNKLSLLMAENPPAAEDAPIVARMAKIGIVAGKKFDLYAQESKIARALTRVPKLAIEQIMNRESQTDQNVNGWIFSLDTGVYGTNYMQRAYVAAIGLGANLPQDAVYPYTDQDSDSKPLNGRHKYVIHFDKGETPPGNGFWSLTMYNAKFFLVSNSLNRYSLSPRNPLVYNTDGSLDLYIQNESPGKDKEANWLPSPRDVFVLMLRIYWPKESLLNGSWKPPSVQIAK